MTIEELFKSFSAKKVTVLLNSGNRGDGLIHLGGRALLDKYKVDYTEIEFPQEASGDSLFLYGCGGFCLWHNHNVDRVNFYKEKFKYIYVLPASFDLSCDKVRQFIINLPEKVILYCRERGSFEQIMEQVTKKENVFLDKDLAFYVDYAKWEKKGWGSLFAFRADKEARFSPVVLGFLRWLTRFFRFITVDDISRGPHTDEEAILKIVSKYRKVFTDRAHVAIAASMLGKETYLYTNKYHKMRGIFEYSLSSMPNVKLVK
ncbi:MAG: polysaccharide pyruvyl transferase family protein [Candidatus Omnitrophica bacterium]|nr:polysaccharide pyruvyl transferase family protein [Candidatus Omnitrophota bacterium]